MLIENAFTSIQICNMPETMIFRNDFRLCCSAEIFGVCQTKNFRSHHTFEISVIDLLSA